MFAATENYVREVIHAFDESGFAALDPKWSGGRPVKFGPAARELVCRVARSAPCELGLPFTTWSLSKLAAYLRERHRLVVSGETTRRILHRAGISVCDTHQAQNPGMKLICGRTTFIPGFCVVLLYGNSFGVSSTATDHRYPKSPTVTRKGSLCDGRVVGGGWHTRAWLIRRHRDECIACWIVCRTDAVTRSNSLRISLEVSGIRPGVDSLFSRRLG